MVNLNNIFNKFYPKATTSPAGKKLIYMAWAIEITVAMVGFTIAYFMVQLGREETLKATSQETSSNVEYYIIGLAFFVVGLMELTKIPLATALYYAARTYWKIIFFVALIAVNFSTFETIIQGFELSYNKRLEVVNIERNKLEKLRDELKTLGNPQKIENKLAEEIKEIQEKINNLNSSISNINIEENNALAQLENENATANPKKEALEKRLDRELKTLNSYRAEKSKQLLALQSIKSDFTGRKRKAIREEISNINENIKSQEKTVREIEEKIENISGNIESKNEPRINKIKKESELRREEIRNQITRITDTELNPKQKEKSRLAANETVNNEKIGIIQKQIDEQRKIVIDKASSNQIYRLALMIKIGPGQWFFDEEVSEDISEAELTKEDIDKAFWLWFGFLAFIISIIGTLVAFAGLHLMDERMHEIRNKPIIRKNTFFYRFSKMFVLINRYLASLITSTLKPKTIEKIVEKKVKVEVEKPVYEEKIVYQKVEVPKEVTRKEIVHVPLWTQDPDLLSKQIDPSFVEKPSKKKK